MQNFLDFEKPLLEIQSKIEELRHLKDTSENIANELSDNNIIRSNIIPAAAIIIAISVLFEIFSFKKIYANKAAIKGIAPNIIKVTAAVVVVIENTNVILATPRHAPPINPGKPISL